MTHDPTRDCEHGRLKGKCDVCDLQAEVLEQSRINGMSAEREDALRAELTRLKASIALDKMAENARDLGLDCEPAVQEPVFCEYCGGNDDADFGLPTDHCTDCARPQPVLAPKPWVGLTDEDIEQGHKESWVDKQAFESAVWWAEKKLKEKNT
jgi:hypothetical protein